MSNGEIRGAISIQHKEICYVILDVDPRRGRVRARCFRSDLSDVSAEAKLAAVNAQELLPAWLHLEIV